MDVVTMAVLEDIVEEAVEGVQSGYTPKASVATADDLPTSGNEVGDVRIVREDGTEWVWDGTQWVQRGTGYIPIPEEYIRAAFD